MTKEMLAKLRGMGFDFDAGWDAIATVAQQKSLNLKFINAFFNDKGITVNLLVIAKGLLHNKISYFLESNCFLPFLNTMLTLSTTSTIQVNKTNTVSIYFPLSNAVSLNLNEFVVRIICDGIAESTEKFQLQNGNKKQQDIVKSPLKIVLDPGHGYLTGNTGAVCFIYKYKIKGKNGEPEQTENKEYKFGINDI